jgi:hypothetical protein
MEHAISQLWHPVHLSGWIISIILMRTRLSSPAANQSPYHYLKATHESGSGFRNYIWLECCVGPWNKSLIQIKLAARVAGGCAAPGDHRIRPGKARVGGMWISFDA